MSYFDRLLQISNILEIPVIEGKKLRFEVIKEIFVFHYTNNPMYKKYCKKCKISPSSLKDFNDLNKIPFLTTWFLKEIFSSDRKLEFLTNKNIINLSSSGTTQAPVFYPFDEETLRRSTLAHGKIINELLQFSSSQELLILLPHPRESGTGISKFHKDTYEPLVKKIWWGVDKDFKLKWKLIKDCLEKSDTTLHIIGTHFIWYELLMKLKKDKLSVALPSSKAVLTGGWKGREKKMSNKEFYNFIARSLNIQKRNIREQYGNIDVYTVFLSCECNRLHVHPWAYVSIRDKNLEEVCVGEKGVAVILTSIVTSYPAFILTSDKCKLTIDYDEKCECGRIGPTIEVCGRIKKEELNLPEVNTQSL